MIAFDVGMLSHSELMYAISFRTDLVAENPMAVVGATLSTTGASLCAFYVMSVMIFTIRSRLRVTIYYRDTRRHLSGLQCLFVSISQEHLVHGGRES